MLQTDNFTWSGSGWDKACDPPHLWQGGYLNGEYQVISLPNNNVGPGPCHSWRYQDFEAGIEARLLPPTKGAYVHLEFRLQDRYNGTYAKENAYVFSIEPDTRWADLTRLDGGKATTLANWTDFWAINRGTAPNQLSVRVKGAEIIAKINNYEVGRVRDSSYVNGIFAFGVGHYERQRAEARFTRFWVASVD